MVPLAAECIEEGQPPRSRGKPRMRDSRRSGGGRNNRHQDVDGNKEGHESQEAPSSRGVPGQGMASHKIIVLCKQAEDRRQVATLVVEVVEAIEFNAQSAMEARRKEVGSIAQTQKQRAAKEQ